MIAVAIILAIFLILLAIGRKSAHAEVTIPTQPEIVWENLSNVSKVKAWNSILIPIAGELKEGSKVTYEFYQDEGGKAAVMSAAVKEIVPLKMINQTGGMPLILTFDHKYLIEQVPEGTKVTIHEEYRGVMVPFLESVICRKSLRATAGRIGNRSNPITMNLVGGPKSKIRTFNGPMSEKIRIETVSQVHEFFGYDKPKHPLVSVLPITDEMTNFDFGNYTYLFDLYQISLKKGIKGSISYGRNSYDHEEGALIFPCVRIQKDYEDVNDITRMRRWHMRMMSLTSS